MGTTLNVLGEQNGRTLIELSGTIYSRSQIFSGKFLCESNSSCDMTYTNLLGLNTVTLFSKDPLTINVTNVFQFSTTGVSTVIHCYHDNIFQG